MIIILVLLVLLTAIVAVTPPNYNYSFHVTFQETYISVSTHKVSGQTFYDPKNNRQRVDRVNGRYNVFCSSVFPNIDTPCLSYTLDNKRWLVFPNRTSCCFCCDSAHGCGILKPDWLAEAEYKGQDKIVDTVYDKWYIQGAFGSNQFWATTDQAQIPRKLDEAGNHITDYSVQSFQNQTNPFAESVFALPSYCKVDKPTNCPLTICGRFREQAKE